MLWLSTCPHNLIQSCAHNIGDNLVVIGVNIQDCQPCRIKQDWLLSILCPQDFSQYWLYQSCAHKIGVDGGVVTYMFDACTEQPVF